jgi:2-dehydro-3-deoxyphosphogluconate aldolase/(4S)-4-hydroxy-2-oxoglutarate aldolase
LAEDRHKNVQRMERTGLVAVIRVPPLENAVQGLVELCGALRDGGIDVAEITMTSPGAMEAIEAARERFGEEMLIGVGSVLDAETCRAAIGRGAQFVVSPVLREAVIETAHRYGCPAVPGAFTPTEALTAWEAGADMVKIFPANHVGPGYFKDLRAPMPQLKLTPTGGVNLDTAADWISAGAACLGVGSALVRKDLVTQRDWEGLTALAGQFVARVRQARDAGE